MRYGKNGSGWNSRIIAGAVYTSLELRCWVCGFLSPAGFFDIRIVGEYRGGGVDVIVVRVAGGLGNQMFQYACGRALAERNHDRLYFDLSAFRTYRLHGYGLDGFSGEVVTAPWYLTTGGRVWSVARRFGFSKARYFRLLGIRWVGECGDLRYRPQLLQFSGSAYLDGYWQSASYFEGCEELIRKDFSLSPSLDKRLQERRSSLGIGQGTTASLHVRRGDYATNPSSNAVHGTLGEEYYRNAVEHLIGKLGEEFRLVVFSDDIAWARENLRFPVATVHVEPEDDRPQVDMHLMASCDHHIIANSTFSWWGAWLNPSLTKTVVAPARWFRSADHCADDICPAAWVRI